MADSCLTSGPKLSLFFFFIVVSLETRFLLLLILFTLISSLGHKQHNDQYIMQCILLEQKQNLFLRKSLISQFGLSKILSGGIHHSVMIKEILPDH